MGTGYEPSRCAAETFICVEVMSLGLGRRDDGSIRSTVGLSNIKSDGF